MWLILQYCEFHGSMCPCDYQDRELIKCSSENILFKYFKEAPPPTLTPWFSPIHSHKVRIWLSVSKLLSYRGHKMFVGELEHDAAGTMNSQGYPVIYNSGTHQHPPGFGDLQDGKSVKKRKIWINYGFTLNWKQQDKGTLCFSGITSNISYWRTVCVSHCPSKQPFKRMNQDHGTKRDGWQSAACLGLWKKIKLATRASDAFVFPHNVRKMGDIRNLSWKDMSSHQFPLMDTPVEPISLWFLLTFPLIPIVCSPYPAFPALPACYSQIPNHSSHIFLYSSSPSFTSLHPTSSPLHSELSPHLQSCRLPSRTSVSLELPPQSGPASSVPLAPTPLPTLPSQRRPGSPPPDRSRASLPHFWPLHPRGAGLIAPPEPPEDRSRERTRRHPPPHTPRPITGPAAAASSRDGLCRPRCRRRPSPGGKEGGESESRARGDGRGVPRAAGRGGRAGGQVGRQEAEGGRLRQLGRPRQQPPRTAPAPANNRIRPQRSGSYRRRHVLTEPGGRLGNGVCVRAPRPAACRELEAATGAKPTLAKKRAQEALSLLQRTLGKRVWRRCSLLKRKRGDPQLQIFND